MTDKKIERQYRWPPEVCHMLEIIAVLTGRTMEDASAIAVRAYYTAVQSSGNLQMRSATDSEQMQEIIRVLRDNPDFIRIIQKTPFDFRSI